MRAVVPVRLSLFSFSLSRLFVCLFVYLFVLDPPITMFVLFLGVKYPGDDCPPVWGTCGHALHMQCIMKWLDSQQNTRQECPMCRQAWNFRAS